MPKNKKDTTQPKKNTVTEASDSIKKTYSSIENVIKSGYEAFSQFFDYLLFNERFAKWIAILLAALLYFYVNGFGDENIITSNIQQSVVLENIPVTSNVSSSVYEVEGLPEYVTVTISGDNTDVQFASQQKKNYQVLADLSDLSEGTHEVTLQPLNFSNKVNVAVEPSKVMVTIDKKISRSYAIQYDYINTDGMDKIYSLSEPEMSQTEAIVRASEETMNQISFVKALIDVNGVTADFEQEAVLVAYNQAGEKIDVDILPGSINVKVHVSTPNKEVPIEIVPEGAMEEGVSIESYEVEPKTITLYAPQSVLNGIDKISITVPVNKIVEDTSITMPILLPSDVSKGSATKVKIKIKVKNATSKVIEGVPIVLKNYNENFDITIDGGDSVDVTIEGTTTVVKELEKDDITVILDLDGFIGEGVYEVPLTVIGSNNLANYKPSKEKVKVTMKEKE